MSRISPIYFNINPVDPDSHQQQGVKSYIYIKPADPADQKPSSLVLINHTRTPGYEIQFKGNDGEVSDENYHFYLEFDYGLLDDPASIQVQTEGWSVYYDKDSGFTTLYFLTHQALSLSTTQNLTLTLQNIFASQSEGPSTTTVTLGWNDDSDYIEIEGSAQRYDNEDDHTSINIVNITHQNSAPLYVNFESTNMVLNDGQTSNSLTLRITNVSDKSLALATKEGSNAQFTINFDYDPNSNISDSLWALLDPSTADAVHMSVSYKGQSWGEAQRQSEGNQYTWTFSAPDNASPLDPYSSIDVTITGIKTAYPTGQSNIYLHTTNTPGHWDGYYTAVIEKSPLIYSGARVGIGTNKPGFPLEVSASGHGIYQTNGEVQVGSYANTEAGWLGTKSDHPLYFFTHNSTSPWMTLDTSGKLGIGTETPQAPLDVHGDAAISGQLTVGSLSRLTVNGDSTLSGQLTVNSATSLQQLTVDGNSTLDGQLTVNSATSLQQLTVNGNTTISGKLGLGTTGSHNAKLTIQSTTRTVDLLLRSADGSSGSTYYDAAKIEAGWEDGPTAWNQAFIKFYTHPNNNGTLSPALTVKGGNVGIGTVNPQATLDVHGNLNVSGSLTVGNITLTEENLKFLKGLAEGTAVVNFITQNDCIIDNYYRTHDDGDADRTIQFSNKNASTWTNRLNYAFKLLIAVDGHANRSSY